jgi:hypothetical protein
MIMKLLAIVTAAKRLAPVAKRVLKGVKDIKHLHKAIKENKADGSAVPVGQVDYVRMIALGATVLTLVFGILAAFGVIDSETYQRLLDVLTDFTIENV